MLRYLTLFAFFLSISLNAQTTCSGAHTASNPALPATEATITCNKTSNTWQNHYALPQHHIPDQNDPIITISVALHIWRDKDGNGNYTNSQQDISYLTNLFETTMSNGQFLYNPGPSDVIAGVNHIIDTRIRIKLQGIYFYDDDNFYQTGVNYSAGKALNAHALAINPECVQSINFHFSGDFNSNFAYQGYSGGTLQPGPFNAFIWTGYTGDGLGTGADPLNTNIFALKVMLTHELLHVFDLWHTDGAANFPETLDPNNVDFLSDVFTPPYAYHDGGWNLDPTDPTNTATNNSLGNTSSSAYLSPIQIGRIRRALYTDPVRMTYSSGYSSVPLEITNDETWDFTVKLYQDVIVKSGSKLTIKCIATFVPEAKLIVEPGAELIIDGGKLQEGKFEEHWQGIYVGGNSSLPQTPSNQGVITAIDGEIRGARNGITNINVNSNGEWIWGSTGGIISCTGTKFLNNMRDVQLLKYISPNAKNEKYQASFINCTFQRGASYGINSIIQSMTMWGVAGVDIMGCTFKNLNNGDVKYDGGAIYTINATYKVNESVNGDPCIFEGYADAIRSEGDISVAFPIKIIGSQFENNIHSVYLNSVVGSRVSHNSFKVRTSHSYIPPAGSSFQNSAYGVYLDYSSGFALEENVFENLDNPNNLSAAIVVKDNGGASDQVYHNTIDDFYYGIQAIGNNQSSYDPIYGLNFICNNCGETNANTKDIQVDANGQVGGIQGENLRLPSNQFSPNTLTRHFDNFGSYTITYEYGTGDPRVVPSQYLGINPVASTNPANISINCPVVAKPEALPGPVLTELNQIENALIGDRLLMTQLIDEGSTPQLESQILFASNQTEYQTLYLDLMDISPYVSIDNLLNLIYIEDYPELALRNILLANPHGLRDGQVWDAITNRTPALSQQTIDDLENGQQTITAKDVLDRQIANKQVSSERLSNQYIRYYADNMDSVGLNSLAVIENHLRSRDELQFRYALVDLLLYKDQVEAAHDVLDSIPLVCEMGVEDEADYYGMMDYYNLLRNLSTEEYQIEGQAMTDLMDIEATGSGYAVGRARALLKLNNQPVSYVEPLIDQNGALMSKRALVVDRPEFALQTFDIYPNPASTVAVIQWDADKEGLWEEEISIRIMNMVGAVMHDQVIPDASINAAQINVSSWTPGTYIVEVLNKDISIFKRKLNVKP